MKSFWPEFCKTDAVPVDDPSFTVSSTDPEFIGKVRKSNQCHFVFFRNFSETKTETSTVSVTRPDGYIFKLELNLPYKHSFIGLGNYTTKNGLKIFLSTVPVFVRWIDSSGVETWIIQNDSSTKGQLACGGALKVSGSLVPERFASGKDSIISFKESRGFAVLQNDEGDSLLKILALSARELSTLAVYYKSGHNSLVECPSPTIFWGANGFWYDPSAANPFTIVQSAEDEKIFCISPETISDELVVDDEFSGFEGLRSLPIQKSISIPDFTPILFEESKKVKFGALSWTHLELDSKRRPILDPVQLCYTSGLVAYKLKFDLPQGVDKDYMDLKINMRHVCTVWINGDVIGGHFTYNLGTFRPGTRMGADYGDIYGWETYSVLKEHFKVGANELLILVENLGINRAFGPFNDMQNKRGLLNVQMKGVKFEWYIAGVDVRGLDNAYSVCGIPDDGVFYKPLEAKIADIPVGITKPTWYRGKFSVEQLPGVIAPMQLRLSGKNMAHIFVNNTFIGRYHAGRASQTDFYIPEKLLSAENTVEILTFGNFNRSELKIRVGFYEIDGLLKSGNQVENGKIVVFEQKQLSATKA
jgi:hypothetical protein